MRKNYTILIYKIDDIFELPLTYCDDLEECALWIGCSVRAFYKNMKVNGYMEAKGYRLELVSLEGVE